MGCLVRWYWHEYECACVTDYSIWRHAMFASCYCTATIDILVLYSVDF